MNITPFVETKRNNFCEYLIKEFGNDPNVEAEIEKYKKVPVLDFLIYIRENIAGLDLEKYVDEKFSAYLPGKKLTAEVHNKIVRYLEMFVALSK